MMSALYPHYFVLSSYIPRGGEVVHSLAARTGPAAWACELFREKVVNMRLNVPLDNGNSKRGSLRLSTSFTTESILP